MGFDANGTRFLLTARSSGVDFTRSAMIGRQKMHLTPQTMRELLEQFGYRPDSGMAERILDEDNRFAEPFLRILGATEIDSFDASAYEKASRIHDMNRPMPDEYRYRYTVVIDGGTLEHVFNFPVAIRNCMEMVEVGGFYLAITPANNFMGHGFYQFSPELYFRVFSPANGFVVEAMYIFEDVSPTQWVRLTDPDILGRRVEMVNSRPAYLLVQARRLSDREIFGEFPQQSDYSASWKQLQPG